MKNYLFILVALVFGLTSCANLEYFTEDLKENQGWSETQLRQIQFYNSEKIVLRRQKITGDTRIEDGDINFKSGKNLEEIIIKRRTPGLLVKMPKSNQFYISFDSDDGKYLVFSPHPKKGNRYLVQAKEWKNKNGKVQYGGDTYFITSESSFASLLVDIKKYSNIDKNKSRAKGRKI